VDDLIPDLARHGLSAIEVFHPDHGPSDVGKYRRLSAELGLAMTGGSDYHGPAAGRIDALGTVVLPEAEFMAFEARRASS
jgi:predicted metal-dependent phosphoesterase TrpH